jgi:putative photosynthetic complex assembly protein 2
MRFREASRAVIHNEIATGAGALIVAAMTWRAPNRIAWWTYLILWAMRLSAKLNLFLGVPNLGERFMPAHLQYLQSYFRRRPINALFPVSIGISAAITVLLARSYLAAGDAFKGAYYALLTTIVALGTLEHLFMVVPMGNEKLWSWALKPCGTPGSNPTR